MTTADLYLLDIPREGLLTFFITFSRFEYALKKAGYIDRRRPYLSPDWKRLGDELSRLEESVLSPVLSSCPYLIDHPPRRQVEREGRLEWEDLDSVNPPDVATMLKRVTTVRNNLFHGGKFPGGLAVEPARDENLICDCVSFLTALLRIPAFPPEVAQHFHFDTG